MIWAQMREVVQSELLHQVGETRPGGGKWAAVPHLSTASFRRAAQSLAAAEFLAARELMARQEAY